MTSTERETGKMAGQCWRYLGSIFAVKRLWEETVAAHLTGDTVLWPCDAGCIT